MIGRVNIIQGDPNRVAEGIVFIRDRVQPVVDSLPGSRGLGMWANRETGEVIVNTVWEDQAALDASESHVAGLRAEAASVLSATTVRVEMAEPVALWQAAADQPGYWSRGVEMDLPTDRIEEGITLFHDEILPAIQQIPGVNTVVLLANRATGHTVLVVTYRSRDELDAGRAAGDKLRAGVVARLGTSEPIVHELETVIVGIRGPGTIDLTATEANVEV